MPQLNCGEFSTQRHPPHMNQQSHLRFQAKIIDPTQPRKFSVIGCQWVGLSQP